jgi:hypothetical protein
MEGKNEKSDYGKCWFYLPIDGPIPIIITPG